MSFSSDVKKELLGQVPRSRHCQLAELAGIINMDGAIDKDTGCLVLESKHPASLQTDSCRCSG